jgi:hypothetical protein
MEAALSLSAMKNVGINGIQDDFIFIVGGER